MIDYNEFFLVLPSTSSAKYFENTASCFKTHLEREIKPSGLWSVRIAEAYIPSTLIHFDQRKITFSFLDDPYNIPQLMNPKFKICSYSFKQGIYQDVAELADSINESFDIADHQLIEKEVRYDDYWRVQRVSSCTSTHRKYFNSKVFNVFGFSDQDSYENPFIETTEPTTDVKLFTRVALLGLYLINYVFTPIYEFFIT